MAYYPVMVQLQGRVVVVVGGGEVAARKVEGLKEVGARVKVVAPRICPRIRAMGGVELVEREFKPDDIEGALLVIAAADSEEVNRRVAEAGQERGVLVNVVDQPELCSFIVPSVLRRGRLVVAVSTSGASPAVAARLRRRLEGILGGHWAGYLELLARVRARVLERLEPGAHRHQALKALADPGLEELVARGEWESVNRWLSSRLGPGYSLKELGLDPGGEG